MTKTVDIQTSAGTFRIELDDANAPVSTQNFLDYVQSLPSDGPVFPKLQPDRHGFLGTNIGKRWAAYLRETLKLDSPASPSHGFRHTFKTLSRGGHPRGRA